MKKCHQTCHSNLGFMVDDKYSFINTYKIENKMEPELRIKDIT